MLSTSPSGCSSERVAGADSLTERRRWHSSQVTVTVAADDTVFSTGASAPFRVICISPPCTLLSRVVVSRIRTVKFVVVAVKVKSRSIDAPTETARSRLSNGPTVNARVKIRVGRRPSRGNVRQPGGSSYWRRRPDACPQSPTDRIGFSSLYWKTERVAFGGPILPPWRSSTRSSCS